MDKKLNATIKFADNDDFSVKEVIFFASEFCEWIDVLFFHALAILY